MSVTWSARCSRPMELFVRVISGQLSQNRETQSAGYSDYSKTLSSKAAGSGSTESYPLGTSQGVARPRTQLAGFFNSLPQEGDS